QNHLGSKTGREAWDDAMLFNDPEAPTTTKRVFDYGEFTGGRVTGSVAIDEGSIESFDPRAAGVTAPKATAPKATASVASTPASPGTYPAAGPVPSKQA